jgi:hypothetical protein
MISSFSDAVRRSWAARSQKPFARLVRLFVGRIFHGGDSGNDELGLGMGLVLSLLAMPGGFYSLLLLEKYATLLQWMRGQREMDRLAGALPDEYFFIVLSMTITGVVAVWRWDSIFPDRRDFSNLVPLPLATRTIFFANLTAVLYLALILAVDVNAISAVLFPLVVSASENAFGFFAQFIGVHALVVALASVFSFFAVFAVVGILMIALPYREFRWISFYLRVGIIAALVMLLSSSFAIPALLEQLPDTWAKFLPPVWFLGLCQWIRGKASPPLALLGRAALLASAVVVVASVMIYAVSYRRCFTRIPEAAEIAPGSHRAGAWIFWVLDRTILLSAFQRAGYRFVMKTLLRSERHGLVLGGFGGLGTVTALMFLFDAYHDHSMQAGSPPSTEALAIPLVLSYCIILGVRFAFDIPSEIRANWIFQFCLNKAGRECFSLARKVMLTFVLPWVVAIGLPAYGYVWGWRIALLQTVVVSLSSFLLAEIVLLRYRKLPFTCSYPPFHDSAVLIVLLYIMGFAVFVVGISNVEFWARPSAPLMAALIVALLSAWFVLARVCQNKIADALIFEEGPPAAFERLNLQGWS